MLVIRMQRTGRKGHAMFRVVVQDSRRTPTSGKVVAALGSYDPHSKNASLNKDKIAFYLEHGAQPSPRVTRLLKAEGIKLPKWVVVPGDQSRAVRNPDKRRSTRPPEAEGEPEAAAPSETAEASSEEPATDETKSEDKPAEEAPEAEVAETSEEETAAKDEPVSEDTPTESSDEA